MVYDIYKYLVENEETILDDLSMLKYIKVDLDRCIVNYMQILIKEQMSTATPEEQLQVLQDGLIIKYIDNIIETIRRMLYGDANTLH